MLTKGQVSDWNLRPSWGSEGSPVASRALQTHTAWHSQSHDVMVVLIALNTSWSVSQRVWFDFSLVNNGLCLCSDWLVCSVVMVMCEIFRLNVCPLNTMVCVYHVYPFIIRFWVSKKGCVVGHLAWNVLLDIGQNGSGPIFALHWHTFSLFR